MYSQGIWVLAVLCGWLLILFGGVTDRLIPLYAVGAFLAFTLSQAGMVAHWRRTGGKGSGRSMFVNGLGATATATTVVVVTVAKFVQGAWVTVLLIPAMMTLMFAIRRHYRLIQAEIASDTPLDLASLREPLVVVPILSWNRVAQKGLRFALTLSSDVEALHIECEKDKNSGNFCQIMGTIRRGTGETSGTGGAAPGRAVIAVSLRHQSHRRLHTGTATEKPRPANRRADPRVGGAALGPVLPA